jgi:ABC-type transport system involved in cytochrome c biogenesis ATPase subunit
VLLAIRLFEQLFNRSHHDLWGAVIILGKSGAGKSSLLGVLCGLEL